MDGRSGITIKKKIFRAIYSLILLLTLVVDGLVFYTYKNDIENKILYFGNQTIDEMSMNMAKNILSAEESITFKIDSCNLFSAGGERSKYEENSKEIKVFVSLIGNSGMKVQSCYLERVDETKVFWTNGTVKKEDFTNSKAGKYLEENKDGWNQNRGTVLWRRFSDAPDSIYIIKNVINPDTLKKEGVLCLEIDESYFQSMESSRDLSIVICDEKGDLLYNSEEIDPIIRKIIHKDNQDYLTMNTKISKKNWALTGLISKHQALNNLQHLMFVLLLIEVIFFFISFFISNYVSENMTTNIKSLIMNMKRMEQGQPPERIKAKSEDETAYLVEAFNNMNQKLQDTIDQLIINQTQKEKAEYNALIAQLNPHFLYNSLESISSMAKLSDQRDIVDAIGNLSKLLRVCLSEHDAEISLKKELDYITQYLSLEKLITGGQMEWDIDCGENLLDCRVPKLILQPLVENSIVHGFHGFADPAIIIIVVREEHNDLVIEVSDNGNGMPQAYADKILASKEVRKPESDRRHIGIKSIQQRITYLYGETYGLEIRTMEQAGTTIKLRLPINRGIEDVSGIYSR
ncbi:MAG TPA: histidine kinase [Candidatus Pelethocola excrementipullorum]|nr:histidine kinase [Candidatus Pelethocola excrementipullorum]